MNIDFKSFKTECIAGLSMFFAIWTMAFLYAQIMQNFNYAPQHWFVSICILTVTGCLWSSIFIKQPFIIAPGLGMGWFFCHLLSPETNPQTLFLAVSLSGPIIFLFSQIRLIREAKTFLDKHLQETINIGIGCLFIRIALEQQFGQGQLGQTQHLLFGFSVLSLFFFKFKNKPSGLILSVVMTIILGYLLEPKTLGHIPAIPASTQNLWSLDLHLIQPLQLLKHILEIALFSLFDIAIGVFCLQQLQVIMHAPTRPSLACAYQSAGLNNLLSGFLLCGPNTTYIESSIGIQIGSKTSISILMIAICYGLFLFCYPIGNFIPSALFRGILFFIGCSLITPLYLMRYRTITNNLLTISLVALMIYQKSIMDGLIAAIISNFLYNKIMKIPSPPIIRYSTLLALIILGLRFI
jgi:AGZA family xanthine/uracil permease-like MFS transporter